MEIKISLDKDADVLYVRAQTGMLISNSEESSVDCDFIMNLDKNGNIIGVQILGISQMLEKTHLWFEHPNRLSLPTELRKAIDEWVENYQFRDRNKIAEQIYGPDGVLQKILGVVGRANRDASKEGFAMRAAQLIWEDLEGRSGTGTDQIDDTTKKEILEEWRDIIMSQWVKGTDK